MKWTFWDNILQEYDFIEIAFDARESLFNTLISNSARSLSLSLSDFLLSLTKHLVQMFVFLHM